MEASSSCSNPTRRCVDDFHEAGPNRNPERVYSAWRYISKDSILWRSIDMHNLVDLHDHDIIDFNLGTIALATCSKLISSISLPMTFSNTSLILQIIYDAYVLYVAIAYQMKDYVM